MGGIDRTAVNPNQNGYSMLPNDIYNSFKAGLSVIVLADSRLTVARETVFTVAVLRGGSAWLRQIQW